MLSRIEFSPDCNILNQLRLTIADEILLKYFLRFKGSGAMKEIIRAGETWSWLRPAKAQDDLSRYFPTKRSVLSSLGRLCGRFRSQAGGKDQVVVYPEHLYPLACLIIKTQSGTLTYFRPRPDVILQLDNPKRSPMQKLLEADTLSPSKEGGPILKGPAYEILKTIMDLPAYDQAGNLFTNRFIPDPRIYSGVIKKAWKMINDVYQGTFTKNRQLAAWFLKQYGVEQDQIQNQLMSVKGSWPKVMDLVLLSVRRFHSCFRPDRIPENKDKLPRSVAEFFFKMTSDEPVSMFMVLAVKAPDKVQELVTDAVFDSLPENVRQLGEGYRPPTMNQLKYWSALKSINQWYSDHRDKMQAKDSAILHWMPSRMAWLNSYFEFVLELSQGIPSPGNFGLACPTWACFLSKAKQKHGISIKLEKYQ